VIAFSLPTQQQAVISVVNAENWTNPSYLYDGNLNTYATPKLDGNLSVYIFDIPKLSNISQKVYLKYGYNGSTYEYDMSGYNMSTFRFGFYTALNYTYVVLMNNLNETIKELNYYQNASIFYDTYYTFFNDSLIPSFISPLSKVYLNNLSLYVTSANKSEVTESYYIINGEQHNFSVNENINITPDSDGEYHVMTVVKYDDVIFSNQVTLLFVRTLSSGWFNMNYDKPSTSVVELIQDKSNRDDLIKNISFWYLIGAFGVSFLTYPSFISDKFIVASFIGFTMSLFMFVINLIPAYFMILFAVIIVLFNFIKILLKE